MKARLAQVVGCVALAAVLAGCGLFGVKGPGLDKGTPSSLDPRCTSPPFELPRYCALAGIGGAIRAFDDSHQYVGSTAVIPGATNYLSIQTSMGRVISFQEQFHANPPLSDHEARQIAAAEAPRGSKRQFVKTVAGMCQVVEYTSTTLKMMYGKQFSAVLIVLRSADPAAFDKKDIATASISLAAPHSRSSINSC